MFLRQTNFKNLFKKKKMKTVVSKCIHDKFKAKHSIDKRKFCLYAIWKLKKKIKSSKTLNIFNNNLFCKSQWYLQ